MRATHHGRQIAAPTHTIAPAPRPHSLQRLHRNLQKNPSGDFAEDCVRSADNSSNPLQRVVLSRVFSLFYSSKVNQALIFLLHILSTWYISP